MAKTKQSQGKKEGGGKWKWQSSRTAQQTIPYTYMFDNGMVMIRPGVYSKTYHVNNMNFDTEEDSYKAEILQRYGLLLNKFNENTTVQVNIINRQGSPDQIKSSYYIRPKADGLTEYREEYNGIISSKLEEGRNDIIKDRYLTVTLEAANTVMAHSVFDTMDQEINDTVKNINGTGAKPLNVKERICLLHDLFLPEETRFAESLAQYDNGMGDISLSKLAAKGITTKDLIAPSAFVNGGAQVQIGEDIIAKSFQIKDLPATMNTRFLSEITNIPCAMITSVIFSSTPRKTALRFANAQSSGIKREVMEAQKKATQQGYDASLISEGLIDAKDEAKFLIKDLTTNNQKLMFATITITIMAHSKEEMNEFTDVFRMRVSDFGCQLIPLFGQQMSGLKTSLPFAHSYLGSNRMLTTESAKAFFPFSVQEIMDKNGHFYGTNAVTKTMILYNRRDSSLANGIVVGQAGSGKSFTTKGEIIQTLLDGDDDVIVIDPNAEYGLIVSEFKRRGLSCDTIELRRGAPAHINPLDLDLNYAAEDSDDPVAVKCEFLVSMCDSILGKHERLTQIDINVIHKAGQMIYKPYVEHIQMAREAGLDITSDPDAAPTLISFYQALLDIRTPESHRLAMALEQYCVGNYNLFSHRTNIGEVPRFLVYTMDKLPKNMKPFAMQVCMDNIWNRIVRNRNTKRRTWIYYDEAHLIMDTENTAATLRSYWKMVRKFGGIMTLITQDIEDILVTQEGRAILSNSGFALMMNQSQIGRSELKEQFSLSDSMEEYMKDKPPGIGLLYNGSTTVPFNYRVPSDTKLYMLMTTNPKDAEKRAQILGQRQ